MTKLFDVICHMILIGSRLAEAVRSGDGKCSERNHHTYAVSIMRTL